MGKIGKRLRRRRKVKDQLATISKNQGNVIIYYSAESLDDLDGRSPRIVSIAILNLSADQEKSFSISRFAERDKISNVCIDAHYDQLGEKMLEAFSNYASPHGRYLLVHWNMRNSMYGFAALTDRCAVLEDSLFEIPELQ